MVRGIAVATALMASLTIGAQEPILVPQIDGAWWQVSGGPAFGETSGGLQAPYVTKIGKEYVMFYGDWENICKANPPAQERGLRRGRIEQPVTTDPLPPECGFNAIPFT